MVQSTSSNPASTRGHEFKDGMRNVGDDAIKLKDDVVGLGRDVADAARSGVAAAKDEVTHGIRVAREQGQKAAETVSDFVTDRPLTSIGVAVGVGVLVGMFLCRSRN